MDQKYFIGVVLLLLLSLYSTNYLTNTKRQSKSHQYQQWKNEFSFKVESQFQDIYRESIFIRNVQEINLHNIKSQRTYDQGINQFTAFTQQQCVAIYLTNFKIPHLQNLYILNSVPVQGVNDAQIDWRTKGAVTPVTNQGQCGSSPYFSAVYALEGLMKISDGSLDVLSVQQIIDCTGSYGNQGCNGGWMVASFKYVIDKGIATNKTYPYKGVNQKCQKEGGQFKISGYVQIASKDCDALANGILINPVATAADASNWFKYKSGIFSDCTNTYPNHGIAMIGMTKDSWIMKNTWDTTWGQSGYIRLARGNTCGVCAFASYPTK